MHEQEKRSGPPAEDRAWPFGARLGVATVGKDGMVQIPAEALEQMDVSEGDKLIVFGNRYAGSLGLVKTDAFEMVADTIRDQSKKLERMSEEILKAATGSPEPKPKGKVGDASDVDVQPSSKR